MEYVLVALWLLVYAGLGALGYPLAARLLSRTGTNGAGFALPVALVVLFTVSYWVGHVAFGLPTALFALLVLVTLAALAGLDREALREGRVELAADLSVNRGAVVDAAVVFSLAFVFLVVVRGFDPAVHAAGGEKYLDFGLLNSLLRAEALPPEDMWFANEPVQYYYGGHLVSSVLTLLTGTAPRYAYNLALAGFYASLVTAAFDLAGAVAADRGQSRRSAGLFAVFFVGFASNLETAGKFVAGYVPGLVDFVASSRENVPYYQPGRIADQFSYWDASRVIPGTINEFPLFAWLNGDLHAHMMGTPFLLLAAALGYAYFRTPVTSRRRRRALVFAAVPVLGGMQLVVDTWSFPSVFGVTWLAMVFAPAHPASLFPGRIRTLVRDVVPDVDETSDGTDGDVTAEDRLVVEGVRIASALGATACSLAVSLVLGAPFLLLAASGRAVQILPADARSSLGALLVVHGAFLAVFSVYLLARIDIDRYWPMALAFAALAVGVTSVPVLVVVAPVLVLGWIALRFEGHVGYETVLVVAGAGLVVLVEFVYVKEQAGPLRMNTVFKTYMQVWVLWATAAGVAVASMFARPRFLSRWLSTDAREGVVTGFVILLVASTSMYGGLALANHFGAGGPSTLDALEFAEDGHATEFEAISWLDAEATSDADILSAPATSRYPEAPYGSYPYPPGMYSWGSSPAASLTGVPTVAGWHHEVGYRGPDAYFSRVRDVDRAYTGSPAEVAGVLREYDVEYVYVGPTERERYARFMTDFESIPGVTVAFENDDVAIYRVNAEELPG